MHPSISIATASLAEIRDNAVIRENALSWLVKYSDYLQPCIPAEGRSEFTSLMKLRLTDPAATYQGSLVLISGVLEAFIARFVDAHLKGLSVNLRMPLTEAQAIIFSHYLARSGYALQHIGSGTVNGVKFDFENLKSDLAISLSDEDDFLFSGDVFTVRFGTCTPEKIEALFLKIGLKGPFDKDLGAHSSVAKWSKDRSPTSAAKYLRDSLDELAELRNNLAHGQPTNTVDFSLVENYCEAVRVFIEAIGERIR